MSSGTPAIAAAATMASVAVIGMKRNSPLSRRMSRVPVSWSMMPAAMNSDALKVAWLSMWKIAATAPSGLSEAEQQGDQAEMADRRIGQQALQVVLEHRDQGAEQQRREAGVADDPDTSSSVPASTGQRRARRKTPAFTIVAECR